MQGQYNSEDAVLCGVPSQGYTSLPARAPSHTPPDCGISTSGNDPRDKGSCSADCPPSSNPQKGLRGGLYAGSAQSLIPASARHKQGTSDKFLHLTRTKSSQNNRSFTQGWGLSTSSTLASTSKPLTPPSSQYSFSSVPGREHNGTMGTKAKSMRRAPGSPLKRPTPDEFCNLVFSPRKNEALLREYVGTDSKYTLAKNHAGMMVRSGIKSQDLASKTREVAEPLDAIDIFLGFLLEHQGLKQDQKGCISLRICFGALTALLGDFGQGVSVENFVSDPYAAVIPREHLGQFRSLNPALRGILYRLAEKLEKSMNLYRHRRSPSGSLVAKFQEMSDTLEVWNRYLMDDTFAAPARIASEWLKNHPNQVENRRRNQAYSEQSSPNLSDTLPSPTQSDLNYLAPMISYGEPSHLSNKGSIRSTGMDASKQYESESLFKSTGVSYFSSNSTVPSSVSYNPNPYRTGGFEGNVNVSALADELQGMFIHQSHSNTQYHTTGSSYSGH